MVCVYIIDQTKLSGFILQIIMKVSKWDCKLMKYTNAYHSKIQNLKKMKLGDIIYYITKYTGIKYIVETFHAFKGTKCNCDKRRKKLNKLKLKDGNF